MQIKKESIDDSLAITETDVILCTAKKVNATVENAAAIKVLISS
jgi:hypothetical protein